MIFIITPVFNRKNFTINYLDALEKQTVKDFKTIIVDDGSTDGTAEAIEERYPNVIVLKEKGDLWWAEATNIGIRYALKNDAEYILTLNDDTLPAKDFIEKMQSWSKVEPTALLGAFAIDAESNQHIYAGQFFDFKNRTITNLLDKLSFDQRRGIHEVNNFVGRGLLIPVNIFKKIGLYDSKNFPQTVADIDFACRAHRNGYKIFCNFDAVIKIFPQESEGYRLKKSRSIRNFFQFLFGKRSGGNLIWFIKFAYKNCPKKYLFLYILIGSAKRVIGYWIKT